MSTATTRTTNKSAAAKSTTAPSEVSAASAKSPLPQSPLPQAPTTKKSMASPSANKSDDKVIAARKKNLDLAISQIQKDFGETAIMRLGDGHRVDVDVIPTGNLLIDRALGVGGFPRGRIVEIYGPE